MTVLVWVDHESDSTRHSLSVLFRHLFSKCVCDLLFTGSVDNLNDSVLFCLIELGGAGDDAFDHASYKLGFSRWQDCNFFDHLDFFNQDVLTSLLEHLSLMSLENLLLSGSFLKDGLAPLPPFDGGASLAPSAALLGTEIGEPLVAAHAGDEELGVISFIVDYSDRSSVLLDEFDH